MSIFLISDKNIEYQQFIAETVEALANYEVEGIAIVALTKDSQALTGYWNMNLRDKLQAEAEIRFDSIDAFLQANAGRYCGDEENNVG